MGIEERAQGHVRVTQDTVAMSKGFYASTTEHHVEWLREVLDMRPAGLSRNTIGLGTAEIKDMARRTLAKMG